MCVCVCVCVCVCKPTFYVPGTPYAVAESDLVVFHHVEMSEVLPLWLN